MKLEQTFTIAFSRFQEGIKISLFSQFLLLQTTIGLSQYMCIFWLKDPASFHDDFWTLFIKIWIVGFSYISQFVFVYQPGKQNINFYLFSGTNPSSDDLKPITFNMAIIVIKLTTIIIHVFVKIRIFVYKKTKKVITTEQSFTKQSKNFFLKTFEKQYLSDFTVFTCFLIGSGIIIILIYKISKLEPYELNVYPNYLMIYWMNLVHVPLFSILLCLLFYYINDTMRKTMTREMKDFLRI